MNILVTGATGGLGYALCRYFQDAGHDVTGTWHKNPGPEAKAYLDLADRESLREVFQEKAFDICFHTAGIAHPDICEIDPDLAYASNVQGAAYIQQSCEEHSVRPVFFSTDYVFSGDKDIYFEEDVPDPLQLYGQTKVQAEEIFMKDPQAVILRIGLLYNDRHGPFQAIYQKLHDDQTEEIRLSDRQIRYPLHTDDVCYYADKIMHEGGPPILHLSGPDAYSKYEAGRLIARFSGSQKPVIPDESNAQGAKRPDHVHLSLGRLKTRYHPYHATRFEEGMLACVSKWGAPIVK